MRCARRLRALGNRAVNFGDYTGAEASPQTRRPTTVQAHGSLRQNQALAAACPVEHRIERIATCAGRWHGRCTFGRKPKEHEMHPAVSTDPTSARAPPPLQPEHESFAGDSGHAAHGDSWADDAPDLQVLLMALEEIELRRAALERLVEENLLCHCMV
jgi:hypothetical protein